MAARGRGKGTLFVKRQQQQQQQQIQQQEHRRRTVVYPVTKGLKSAQTEKQYRWHFNTFLEWLSKQQQKLITDEMIVFDWEPRELEDAIIKYIDEYLHKQKHQKRSTINNAMASILHFCEVNDIWDIRRRKIAMFVPEDEDHKDDRYYEREEIERILKESDKRLRVVFLLLANGMRIGAIPLLELRDLTAWPLPTDDSNNSSKPQKVYQIWVYHRSKKGKYYTFVTPECSQAIDDYLKWRAEETGEDTTITPESEHPLIREQFSLTKPRRKDVAIPRRISQTSMEKIIQRIVQKALGKHTKGKVMLTHGFRKFAITMMAESNVNYGVREYLVGHKHSRGLDNNYVLSKPEKRLVEWSKAINSLTIEDDSYHLEKELQLYKDEYAKKFVQQENEIETLRNQFDRLLKHYGKAAVKLGLSWFDDKGNTIYPPAAKDEIVR